MIEEGFISPGSIVVASDSHSNMYGGLVLLLFFFVVLVLF